MEICNLLILMSIHNTFIIDFLFLFFACNLIVLADLFHIMNWKEKETTLLFYILLSLLFDIFFH